ncbi:hypothetical protein Taro_036582 [Colocasia esculenta]|uniref:Protein kinase domain-containing protein n=1 Tax=Colocasia esculenta TaxID=4460 RepID=A0A843WDS3_COLES|nr:hypothetical protein [Colocasia esculenta]
MQLRRLCLILADDAGEAADPPSPPLPPPRDRHHQLRSDQNKVSPERGWSPEGVKVDVHYLAYHASAFIRRSLDLFCRRVRCLGFGCCLPRHGSGLDPSGAEFHDISGLVDCAAGRPEMTAADANPRIFSYAELYIGTGGFSEKEVLGSGGYGRVYRALLPSDATVAAVKCVAADRSDQFEKTFAAELVAVAQLRHRNLVRLRGWCVHEQQLLLVYDYMPNGSLDRLLFGPAAVRQTLGWDRRRQIVAGLAAALFYLHEQLDTQIIHRDVKSSNVMLDSDYGARLGDFGLARWIEHDGDKPLGAVSMRSTSSASTNFGQFRLADTSKIGGTIGYLPPESFQRQRSAVTAKSDVFSFGIVVLEVVSGRRAVDLSYPDDKIVLLDWVRRLSDEGRCLHAGDSRLPDGSYSLAELRWLLHLALLCTLYDPNSRPTMKWVVEALSSGSGGQQLPALPSFLSHPQYISLSSSSTTATSDVSASSSARRASSASTSLSRYATASNSTVFLTAAGDADDDGNSARGSHSSCRSDCAADGHENNHPNRRQDLLPAFSIVDTPREIPFKEIVALTNDFSEAQMVAEMDFGTGYQGYLENRFHVLVKRLGMKTCPALRLRFADELRNLGRLRHRHLVQLRGWCTEQGEMLVVYDYSSSGLLSHRLFHQSSPVLPWCRRYSIVKALASAVLYLHEEWDEQVIHRSVTSSAVFLDADKNPRLGCFALAEFLTRNNHGNHHATTTSSVRGIFGYMAPEYVQSGVATTKADVYSFGVVVLEVVSGLRAVDLRQPEALLASKVRRFVASKKPLEELVDRRIGEEYDRQQLARVARLGFLCTHSDPESRPSMRQAVSILDGNDELIKSLGGRKKEGMEEWRGRNASSMSLIRRMHALGIH